MGYFELFSVFLKIGAFTFGGGYAMISLIRDEVLARGWMSDGELLNFVAVAESTPGPIAVNIATFVGARQGGILGSFVATLGIVLPSFIIILLIASVIRNFMKYSGVRAFMTGVRPCIVALILSTAMIMGLKLLIGFETVGGGIKIDIKSVLIFVILCAAALALKKIFKKKPSPIIMILISAVLGIFFFSL